MNEIKTINFRLPKELWSFGKKKGVDREMSLNAIVVELLRKYKEKEEKKLTRDKNVVSSYHDEEED